MLDDMLCRAAGGVWQPADLRRQHPGPSRPAAYVGASMRLLPPCHISAGSQCTGKQMRLRRCGDARAASPAGASISFVSPPAVCISAFLWDNAVPQQQPPCMRSRLTLRAHA